MWRCWGGWGARGAGGTSLPSELLGPWRVALVGIAGQEAPEDVEILWCSGARVACFTCRRTIAA